MAAKVRIELNHDGIRSMLCSDEVAGAVESAAQRVARTAGDGFEVAEKRIMGGNRNAQFKGRVGYMVYTDTYEAMVNEAENKTLSRAVVACRL